MMLRRSVLSHVVALAMLGGATLVGGLVATPALALDKIRVGVLATGTAKWEMDTIIRNKLAEKFGLELELVDLGTKLTQVIALESQAADVVLTDYLFTSAQRNQKADYTFVPSSRAAGGLIARPESGITKVADLKGKRIGIFGGPDEDNFVIFRAYLKKVANIDVEKDVKISFVGGAPLLNETILKGDLDAVINMWNFNARLRAVGYKDVVSMPEMLAALGVSAPPPLLGWVFSEKWAKANPKLIDGFLKASLEAKKILLTNDDNWKAMQGLMGAQGNDALFIALRDAYRAGIAKSYGKAEVDAAQAIYSVVRKESGNKGPETLAPGTFWSGITFNL
ncbi:MAG: ABC transporter substrate-binding protein [Alphaproteobacteria bacterium]|nr:ABC transporter substrate-binding protein [Alphaproteobacteria bacterium]